MPAPKDFPLRQKVYQLRHGIQYNKPSGIDLFRGLDMKRSSKNNTNRKLSDTKGRAARRGLNRLNKMLKLRDIV